MRLGAWQSQIGAAFARSPTTMVAAVLVGSVWVVADFLWPVGLTPERLGAALGGVAVLLVLARGRRASLGLTLDVQPGLGFWVKATLIAGAIVVGFACAAVALLWAAGYAPDTRSFFTNTDQFAPHLWRAVVLAPITEEPIYRLLLCAPLIALAGRWLTIIVSGMVFGYLHFHYGNPGPDNFIAGYILAWAYLRSGTLLVPIILHALGNLCVFAANVGYFYYLAA